MADVKLANKDAELILILTDDTKLYARMARARDAGESIVVTPEEAAAFSDAFRAWLLATLR